MHSLYIIKNTINSKCYVGQTKHSIDSRFRQHCKATSKCIALNNSIKKYGKHNFEISLLEICQTQEQANKLEKSYIIKLNTLSPNGYNLKAGGVDGACSEETKLRIGIATKLRGKPSLETRQRMSQSQKLIGNKPPRPTKETFKKSALARKRQVVRIDLKNNQTKYYQGLIDVIQDGFTYQCVSNVCRKGGTHRGFTWRYADQINKQFPVLKRKLNTKDSFTDAWRKKMSASASKPKPHLFKPIEAIDKKTGIVTEFNSVKAAAIFLGLHRTSITNVLGGRNNSTGGYFLLRISYEL